MNRIIYRLYLRLIYHIRTNGMVHRYLFGYRPCRGSVVYGAYWDWTTLAIKKALLQYLRPENTLLDMGTGSVGVLAIFSKLRLGCKSVNAVDQIPEIVSQSQKNAEALLLDIDFLYSDLFSNVNGRFDVIVFNAPYLDSETEQSRVIFREKLSEKRFSGRRGGGEIIDRFLQVAGKHLSNSGTIILGVNHYHINKSVVLDLISRYDYEIYKCVEGALLPGSAYLLRPRNYTIGKVFKK